MTTRGHAIALSIAIGLIAIVGLFALTRTVGLGNSARSATDTQIARQSAALDRYAVSLRRTLARSAARLPLAPAGSTATAPQGAGQPVRIVYHRPPPIVIHKHRSGGEDVAGGRELDD